MIHSIVIQGRFPCLNDYLQAERVMLGGKGHFTTRGNELKKQCQNTIMPQVVKCLDGRKVKAPVELHYKFYETNRRRDKDNIASFFMKVFQDSLTKLHVLDNDGWEHITGFTCEFDVDKENPRIEIEIEEV